MERIASFVQYGTDRALYPVYNNPGVRAETRSVVHTNYLQLTFHHNDDVGGATTITIAYNRKRRKKARPQAEHKYAVFNYIGGGGGVSQGGFHTYIILKKLFYGLQNDLHNKFMLLAYIVISVIGV